MPGGLDGGILGAQGMFGAHAGDIFSAATGTAGENNVQPSVKAEDKAEAQPSSQLSTQAQPPQSQNDTQVGMVDEDEEL